MSRWNDAVKKMWNQNKHKAGYMFKHALQDAKKVYTKEGGCGLNKTKSMNKSKKSMNKSKKNQSIRSR
jgi:hypothetical protein